MKARWLVSLGICIAVASLLLSCSPSSPIVPVTGQDTLSVPYSVMIARDQSYGFIQDNHAMMVEKGIIPALPAADTWRASMPARPDLVDMEFYAFTSGDWIVTVRHPVNAANMANVTYINTKSGFVWSGFVYPDGNVVNTHYTR